VRKKPDRKWIAILVLMTGMAWGAGSSGFQHKPFPLGKVLTAESN
jgi:hypothetical protein